MDKKEQLVKYLKTQKLMALATDDAGQPCVCIVYYAIDQDLNFYFISQPDTLHCKNITQNQKVSCAITHDGQGPADKKIGVQFVGSSEVLEDETKVIEILKLWNEANPGAEAFINLDNMKSGAIK